MKFGNLKFFTILLLALFAATGLSAQDSLTVDYPFANFNAPRQYILKDVKMNGVKYLDHEILISTAGMSRGDTIYVPGEYVSDAVRKLWSQRYFADIKVVLEPEGDSAVLQFFLQERPRVYKWSFEGVRKAEQTELLEKLKLRRGAELSDFSIATSTEVIKRYFRDKSFLNVEVDVQQVTDPVMANGIDVTFVVTKGDKVKIGKITFDGNEVFTDNRLRRPLKKTKQRSINIFASSKFNQAKYDEDKENLIDFYNSKGYRNAAILADSIYAISSNRIGIDFKVEEGNKFYYRNISWLGNSKYTTETLSNTLGIKPGDVYDSKTMNKQLGIGKDALPYDMSVSSLYQNEGYLFSQVEIQETVVAADSLDLEIKIIEGKPATVNKIEFTGNTRVNDRVIRREIDMRPGELYSRALMMSTIQRINTMGHFNPETLSPDIQPLPGSVDLVNISFPLEEMASDKFDISGGWGSGMFVGSVGVVLNNISVRNVFNRHAWRPYPAGDNQQLAIRGQTNGQYYKALSLNFTEPWLGGKKPRQLTLGFYYSDQTNAYYLWQTGDKHFRTIGGSVGFGSRLKWPDHNFTFYTSLSYQAYNLKDWDNFIVKNGTSNIIALQAVLSRSTVDQPIYPRRGTEFSMSLTVTPPYSLFDGKDYADPDMSENDRYRWIEYHKWNFSARWFAPLSNNDNLVLMAKAELGMIGSYNPDKPSPFEGYQVGGDGMSGYTLYGVDIIGMRGYENASLTPSGEYSGAYNKFTLEMRYPFVNRPASTIFGLAFLEAGNAFDNLKQIDPFKLRRSAGLGVRLYLSVVGTIGFDWGYGFDRDVYGKRGGSQLHFSMGQNF